MHVDEMVGCANAKALWERTSSAHCIALLFLSHVAEQSNVIPGSKSAIAKCKTGVPALLARGTDLPKDLTSSFLFLIIST